MCGIRTTHVNVEAVGHIYLWAGNKKLSIFNHFAVCFPIVKLYRVLERWKLFCRATAEAQRDVGDEEISDFFFFFPFPPRAAVVIICTISTLSA